MNLPILSAATLAPALVAAVLALQAPAPTQARGTAEALALVGQGLYASAAQIERWGEPRRAEDVATERLGRVAGVIAGADGVPEGLVVAVGGLWGIGAREVEVGLDRVHLLPSDDGGPRLVLDLSVEDMAAPPASPSSLSS